MRYRLRALITMAGLIPLGLYGIVGAAQSHSRATSAERSALTAAQIRLLAAHATERSIIVFKNQFPDLPLRGITARQRVSAIDASQAPVLAELAALHAKNVQSFQIINAIAATVSPAEVQRLRANPAVLAVDRDTAQHAARGAGMAGGAAHYATAAYRGAADDVTRQVCPSNPARPLVEPEARALMNVNAAQQIADGTGIKIGLIFDGIDPNNPDLIRPNGQHVIFDYQDFSGEGPVTPTSGEALFLAGLISAQGNQVYDLSKFVNSAHPLPSGCTIKPEGMAPGASLAELNPFGNDQAVFNSEIIQAIQYAVAVDHVNVLAE